jgi:hypothetical protein
MSIIISRILDSQDHRTRDSSLSRSSNPSPRQQHKKNHAAAPQIAFFIVFDFGVDNFWCNEERGSHGCVEAGLRLRLDRGETEVNYLESRY